MFLIKQLILINKNIFEIKKQDFINNKNNIIQIIEDDKDIINDTVENYLQKDYSQHYMSFIDHKINQIQIDINKIENDLHYIEEVFGINTSQIFLGQKEVIL